MLLYFVDLNVVLFFLSGLLISNTQRFRAQFISQQIFYCPVGHTTGEGVHRDAAFGLVSECEHIFSAFHSNRESPVQPNVISESE